MKAVSVSWIPEASVWSSSTIRGNAGRYMSVANGTTNDNRARAAVSRPIRAGAAAGREVGEDAT